jgi:hypothetical protein
MYAKAAPADARRGHHSVLTMRPAIGASDGQQSSKVVSLAEYTRQVPFY